MNISIRFDVTPKIGMGHFARIRSISTELRSRDIRYTYVVSAETEPYLRNLLGKEDNSEIITENAWFESNTYEATHVLCDILYSGNSESANLFFKKILQVTSAKLIIIDSMPPDHFSFAEQMSREPDMLITPYYMAEKHRPKPHVARWLYGKNYISFSPDYIIARTSISEPRESSILVSCGGSDPTDLSLRIAECIKNTIIPVIIVLGALYPKNKIIQLKKIQDNNKLIKILPQQSSLSSLIMNSSCVIGRVGLLRYEVALLGRQGIFLSESDDYKSYLEEFNLSKIAEIYFSKDKNGMNMFMNRINTISKQKYHQPLNQYALSEINIGGNERIVDSLLSI